ncbi:hypothetical protein ILYODFUR_024402 [Ilyodon furcidens]|uniref:Uncharacterized protein n=1 Tax=Ilyodon furcidens TaxID=33524 RepID=A0ABV0TMH0_9TELE
MLKALPEVGVEAPPHGRLRQVFLKIRLGLPCLTGILPHHQSQLTTRLWSVKSSAPLFTRVSKTCGHRSDDTTTKSIIELQPRVSWCQDIWTRLCLNMELVMDNP